MSRLAPPLVLLAALAAGRAHAQGPAAAGDRYGPAAGVAPAPASYTPAAPAPLRRLSWPGKTELRPALSPASEAPAAAPMATPTGRFPGVSAYAAPALRAGAARPAPPVRVARTVRPPRAYWPAPATGAAPAPAGAAPNPYATAPYAQTAYAAPIGARTGGSTLPAGLASPPAFVPPGPNFGPALAEQARQRAEANAAPTADTLPPPTVGRYGYVGPGRTPGEAGPLPAAGPSAAAAAPGARPAAATGLGPPRPPAYARAYVTPAAPAPAAQAPGAQSTPPASAPVAALRPGDGGRRYSVHTEYGLQPDPIPVPPQFFGATADLSTPDTAPAAAAHTRGQVNAARLAGSTS